LTLAEDKRGLAFEVTPPDTEWARSVMTSVERGDIDQCSFGFVPVRERMVTENGEPIREILEVRLFDVSVVTFPAYPQTTVTARAWPAEDAPPLASLIEAIEAVEGGELDNGQVETLSRFVAYLSTRLPVPPAEEGHTGVVPPEERAHGGSMEALRWRARLLRALITA